MPESRNRYIFDVVLSYDVAKGYGGDQGEDVVHCVDVTIEVLEHVDRSEG